MPNKYKVTTANEHNPVLMAEAHAEMCIALINSSASPQEIFESVIHSLESEVQMEVKFKNEANEN